MNSAVPTIIILLESIKTLVDISAGIATIIAILVGGTWAYLIFVRTRQKYPRADTSQHISHYPVGNDKMLIHIELTIKNVGDVLLSLESADVRVQRVLPLPPSVQRSIEAGSNPVATNATEINWPLAAEGSSQCFAWEAGKREVEPGETDSTRWNFIVGSDLQTVRVYSYLKNISKAPRDIGWDAVTIYELR